MHRSILLFIVLFAALHLAAGVETIRYDIILFGDKIGTMTVTHELRADGVDLYTLESTSRAKILWMDKEYFSRYDVSYRDGRFVSSIYRELENKNVKRWTNVTWDGHQYAVDGYKGKRSLTDEPGISAISMYFQDLHALKRVFYNAEADYATVQHPDDHTIEFKSSDGTRNVYFTENGRIKSMDIHMTIATVHMVRVN